MGDRVLCSCPLIVVIIDLKTIALRAQPCAGIKFLLLRPVYQRRASSVDQCLCAESLGTRGFQIFFGSGT